MQNAFDNFRWGLKFLLAPDGVVAQLVERLNGIQEVRGSNPLGSTIRFLPSEQTLSDNHAGCVEAQAGRTALFLPLVG